LDGLWPFPWLPLARLLSAGVLMRRCEVVVVFIGLELDTFSSRIYHSLAPVSSSARPEFNAFTLRRIWQSRGPTICDSTHGALFVCHYIA
jgi:hypothetical protein